MAQSNIPCSAAELHRHLDAPDEIRCEDCDIGDPDELTEHIGPTGGAFYLCEKHAKRRRIFGRWYRCGGGVGLEISEDAKAEDDEWSPIGDIEFPVGHSRKYVVRVGREEGRVIEQCSSEQEARGKLVTAVGCEMISNVEAA